jgi:hypothetical protein
MSMKQIIYALRNKLSRLRDDMDQCMSYLSELGSLVGADPHPNDR